MKDKFSLENTKKKNKETIKYIRLYVIPLFAVAFFVGILLLLTIPKINEIFTSLDTISANNTKIAENNQKFATLDALTGQYNSIVQKLSVIDRIAPLGNTEVVRFRDRISNLIITNGLNIISQRLSEANTESETQEEDEASPILLQEVPFIFTVQGTYPNIVNFIQALNSVEDFIIAKEMKLSQSNEEIWELNINIVKYQFNTLDSTNLRNLYINVPIDSKLNELMEEYVRIRSGSTSSIEPSNF